MTYQILHGNNLDILPTLADNSIDSIVTDPPYELGFMGKKWDSSGIAYSVELWQQCLRVLKPGGHLLSFGGTRTYHRVAVAIEDAGFELRDSIAWLYGSGFPKSLDVSKAIDKNNGELNRLGKFTEFMRTTGLTAKQLNDATGTSMGSHYLTAASQPAIPTTELWSKIRPLLAQVPDWVDQLVARIEAEREVIGKKSAGMGSGKTFGMLQAEGNNAGAEKEIDITTPSTSEAQQWQGWGTALKPAFEPVIVARKPIEGTVANNVLKWGTGGLNIDGSRIGTGDDRASGGLSGGATEKNLYQHGTHERVERATGGRWPANIILDPYTAELLDEQSGVSKDGVAVKRNRNTAEIESSYEGGWRKSNIDQGFFGLGGASRFFYVAKASKRDRNEGLEELETKQTVGGGGLGNPVSGAYGSEKAPGKNFHPTVKPTSLMEYLIKLVTPPQGTVLDPFTGSGSTGKAAILQGFDFIGIEMTEEYLPIIEGRLKHAEALVAERIKETSDKESEVLF